jgi:hypothetical protein
MEIKREKQRGNRFNFAKKARKFIYLSYEKESNLVKIPLTKETDKFFEEENWIGLTEAEEKHYAYLDRYIFDVI